MNHISVIVWALCMLQSVSAFAPEPSSDEITPSSPEQLLLPTLGSSPEQLFDPLGSRFNTEIVA